MKIGFVGAGKMATALAQGFIRKGLTTSQEIFASDPYKASKELFEKATGGLTYAGNKELLEQAETIILAVKPQQVREVLEPLKEALAGKLLLSIAAGVTLSKLEALVHATTRVIRVMPNTPALVGEGVSAYSLGKKATSDDGKKAKELFDAVGLAEEVPENWLDAVTGLSGSGPAYFYLVAQAITEAGVVGGIDLHQARRFAAQTMIGAAKMILQDIEKSPEELIADVMSPRGTTEAAFNVFNKYKVKNIFIEAVEAAIARSKELSQSA